jgi:hypothetical protein
MADAYKVVNTNYKLMEMITSKSGVDKEEAA